MGHVQRRGDRRWRARYIGRRSRAQQDVSAQGHAERFLASVEMDKLRGEWVDARLSRRSFGEWAEEFQRSRVNLQPTTRAQQAALLRTHVLPRFGDRPLDSITEMQIRTFVSELLATGRAASTVTKTLALVSQIMRAAVRNQLLARNPCDGVAGPGDKPRGRRSSSPPRRSGTSPRRCRSGSGR